MPLEVCSIKIKQTGLNRKKKWFSFTDNMLAERVRRFQGHKINLKSFESLKVVKEECKGICAGHDAPFPSEGNCSHDNTPVGSI